MKNQKLLLSVVILLIVTLFSGCGNKSESIPSVKESYGEIQVHQTQPAEMISSIEKIETKAFSFQYDSKEFSVKDLSSGLSEKDLFYTIRPASAKEKSSLTHCDLFSGEKVTIDSSFTKSLWEEQARLLVASYYSEDVGTLAMTNKDTIFDKTGKSALKTTVCVAAIKDIPETVAYVTIRGGETNSLVSIVMSYADDAESAVPFIALADNVNVN